MHSFSLLGYNWMSNRTFPFSEAFKYIPHLHTSHQLHNNQSTECEVLIARVSPSHHTLSCSSVQLTVTIRNNLRKTFPFLVICSEKLHTLPKGSWNSEASLTIKSVTLFNCKHLNFFSILLTIKLVCFASFVCWTRNGKSVPYCANGKPVKHSLEELQCVI